MKAPRLVVRLSKAVEQPRLFTVAGDGSIKNNPELVRRKLVDKRGRLTTRYVRPAAAPPAARPPAPVPPPPEPAEEFGDAGEHIPYSRKELARIRAELNDRPLELADLDTLEDDPGAAHELVTLQHVAGKDMLERLQARGASPGAAYLTTKAWSVIAKRPSGDTPRDRRLYVLGAQRVLNALDGARDVNDVSRALSSLADERMGYRVPAARLEEHHAIGGRVRLARILLDAARRAYTESPRDPTSRASFDRATTELRAAQDARRAFEKELRDLDDAQEYPMAQALAQLGDRFRQYVGVVAYRDSGSTAKTRERHEQEARKLEINDDWSWTEQKARAGAGEKKAERPRWDRVAPEAVVRAGAPDVDFTSATLLGAFNLRGVQYGNWMAAGDSREHTRHAGEALTDLAGVLGVPPRQVSLNGRLGLAFGARGKGGPATAHYEPGQTVINLTKTAGGGSLAHEWGHFLDNVIARVSYAGEGGHMTFASDALLKRAKTTVRLGEHVGEEVTMALVALRRAIYEGDNRGERSVTRQPKGRRITRRAALAETLLADAGGDPDAAMRAYLGHDTMRRWLHEPLFDPNTEYRRAETRARNMADYLSVRTERAVTYTLPGAPANATSDFAATATAMGAYWARPVELFARAFEAWVSDELARKGQKNTYLVAGVDEETARAWGEANPVAGPNTSLYPRGEERQRIHTAMGRLVEALKRNQFYAKAMRLVLRGRT